MAKQKKITWTTNPLIWSLYIIWGILLFRGLLAVMFSLLIWFHPHLVLSTLVISFGVYAVADGIASVATAMMGQQGERYWWILFVWGVVSIAIGALTLIAPGITTMILLFYITLWAMTTGVLEIVAALNLRTEVRQISLKTEVRSEWIFVLCGVSSVLFGLVLLGNPAKGALQNVGLIAAYASVFGLLLLIISAKVYNFMRLMIMQYE